MKEIRLHGRGGQGAQVAAGYLANALERDGKYASSFPRFQGQRRGGVTTTFLRFDDNFIRERCEIENPDCLIVTDPALGRMPLIFQGLQPGGVLIIDTPNPITQQAHPNLKTVGMIDATGIAWKEFGTPITNTCLMGAFARTTGWITMDAILSCLEEYYSGELLRKNKRMAQIGFDQTQVIEFGGA